MSPDIISVQFKQKCLSINSVKSLFQVQKQAKRYLLFLKNLSIRDLSVNI